MRPAGIDHRPRRFDGIQYKKIADLAALRHNGAKSGKIRFYIIIIFIISGLMENTARIVALRLALHRIPGKMLAAQIDSEKSLPVSDRLMPAEVELPSRTAVQLGKHPFLANLSGGRRQLLHYPIAAVMLRQKVDARISHMRIETHQRAVRNRLVRKRILMQHMTCKNHSVFVAPFTDRLCKAFNKEVIAEINKIQLDFGNLTPVLAEK